MKIPDNDEIVSYYYDLQEFIEDLQDISRHFKKTMPDDYIDPLDEIWCDAQNELEALEKKVIEIEEAEMREQEYQDNMMRI